MRNDINNNDDDDDDDVLLSLISTPAALCWWAKFLIIKNNNLKSPRDHIYRGSKSNNIDVYDHGVRWTGGR